MCTCLGSFTFTGFSDPKRDTRVHEQHWWAEAASPLPWALQGQLPELRVAPSPDPPPVMWAGRRDRISRIQAKPVSSHNYPVLTSASLAQVSHVLPHPSMQPQTAWLLGQQNNKTSGALPRLSRPIICSLYCPLVPGFSLQGVCTHIKCVPSKRSPSPRGVLLNACNQLSKKKATPSA